MKRGDKFKPAPVRDVKTRSCVTKKSAWFGKMHILGFRV